MFQDFELVVGECGLKTIGEADEKLLTGHRRSAGDHAHRAARMDKRVVRPAHFNQRHDLGAGVNVVRLMAHLRRELAPAGGVNKAKAAAGSARVDGRGRAMFGAPSRAGSDRGVYTASASPSAGAVVSR